MTRRLLAACSLVLAALALAAAPALASRTAAAAKPKGATNQGIVDIFTTLGFQQGEAAGTGIVVTANGEVLTNNHVIRSAATFKVVVVTTGRSYSATVVGYDVQDDVAVLQLAQASGLKTIPLGSSSTLKVGARVEARGNVGGRGGAPSIAAGTVTGLGRSIIASDDSGGSETLTNLIATNADVQPGDSGGPLLNASGRVVGIVTAGSSTLAFQASADRGFAIPINKVLALAKQIVAGAASPRLHIGPTAFLGINVDATVASGAGVQSVLPGTAAEAAGLQAGDVITSLNGTPVASSDDLRSVVLTLTPGTAVPIQWTDGTGATATGTITPASGPPQ